VFLLHNLSRGSGIGFSEERGSHPDFILWIAAGEKQHIVFIEPHGMLYGGTHQHDEKAQLHERLPDLAMVGAVVTYPAATRDGLPAGK